MRFLLIILLSSNYLYSQFIIRGEINSKDSIDFSQCKLGIIKENKTIPLNSKGEFKIETKLENFDLQCSCIEFETQKITILSSEYQNKTLHIFLNKKSTELEESIVIGTIKEINRLENPIITDVYDKKFFTKNPSPNLLDMMDRMNGVRPQVNCNVCGTGDIHLNGLEGPYTLIVLDGVPIVGGLSSVYGLSGIPSFLLDRIEITKGPASSVYGSEAVAGVIHAFTKKPTKNPEIQLQNFTTSNLESNTV
jgi:outer membrane receptor for ferrienterochelin and colicins